MLKVILQYTDCLQDGRNVFSYLAAKGVAILKTANHFINPKVHILVPDLQVLNAMVCDLNRRCNYEVRVVKVKKIKVGKHTNEAIRNV